MEWIFSSSISSACLSTNYYSIALFSVCLLLFAGNLVLCVCVFVAFSIALHYDSVSLFISFNKNILTTFQPVTLAFIRFEVIHKFKNHNKQSQCACAGMRTCVDGG